MPIPLPNLDDRRFADLVEELRALIPRYAPEWTDHNISDPGITLIDLFAWLTEALMYRMNRIPRASEARFLELLGVRFQPAKPARVRLSIRAAGLFAPVLLPRGTPLLSDPMTTGKSFPFESLQDLALTPDATEGEVEARQSLLVTEEMLGASSGRPHQFFVVRHPFLTVETIPVVTIGGETWTFGENLLDAGPEEPCFTLDNRLSAICFGDGTLGRIPPAGSEIRATYRTSSGGAGNIAAGRAFKIDRQSPRLFAGVREALEAGVSFTLLSQTPAVGGVDPTSLAEAREEAQVALRKRWRAITARDFEEIVTEAGFGVARARCVPEKDLTSPDPLMPRRGYVSVVIVPDFDTEKPVPQPEQMEKVYNLLDQRRLVTCRHRVVGAGFTDVRIQATVVRNSTVPEKTVRKAILENLRAFFHPLTGGPELPRQGWPFGRSVFISEVYQILEGTSGVDHVDFLTLSTRNGADGWTEGAEKIQLPPHHLVSFQGEESLVFIETGRQG